MSQENANEKTEKTPQKKTWQDLKKGLLIGVLIGFPLALYMLWVGPYPFPLNTMPVSGTITILDEHGEAMPFQPTEVMWYSLYAPALYRSDLKRSRTVLVDESEKLSLKIPEFATTLCFFTQDKKYAAVVDIFPDMPPTDLTIELIPTYTITGRLVNYATKAPIADKQIELTANTPSSEYGALFPGNKQYGYSRTFHLEVTTTDSEGFFTFDNVVPGCKYRLSDNYHSHLPCTFSKSLVMPILEPEQYQQPFDLGDVVVR